MACSTGNPVGDVIVGFFEFLGDPIGKMMEIIAKLVLSAAISVFGDLATEIPTLVTDGTANEVSAQTQWLVVYTAVGSLIFAAGRMALERKGEAGVTALKGLMRVVLVAGAATAIMTALANLSDRYADHLFAAGAQEQLASIGCGDTNGIESFLLLVLAFLLLIAAIVQTILLYVRLGVMIILLGTLPLAAAASMTDWGGGWWRKHIGWLIAWLLYKPAAGLVIFAGSAMISSGDGDNVNEKIAGIGVLLLSALALPALLKLVVPATAALGTGGSGGTAAMGGALASGAKSIGNAAMSGGGKGGGAGGSSGPSGSRGLTGSGGADGGGSATGAGKGGMPAGGGMSPGKAAGVGGAVAGAALSAAKTVGKIAEGAVSNADGDRGHNR
ncbi:hypothetical protein [Streptomyces sp. IB201691-2A2]|uniref:hypothetical protein n=1 Tax=Streptomyces sp. IB201691-2A2 TaxID=2561920 RepID=UPI00117C575A|nr:hypothetical protein [Streptomyces sp. IB201691-2A2]TRO56027.1 hypothetical protein E4K73_48325 [Streptomyces sp. IB201691-2A2]